jgi:two-component system cell cycle sensor histidine kinase/response regulator CckA
LVLQFWGDLLNVTRARSSAQPKAEFDAPRPPGADEILELIRERDRRATASPAPPPPATRSWSLLSTAAHGAIAGTAVAGGVLLLSSPAFSDPVKLLAGGLSLAAAFILGGTRLVESRLGSGPVARAQLAGAEMLSALNLAERILDADKDARLVTRRDGVVVYANPAYARLAAEAGVAGPAVMPPRIDRLFAQQGVESTKVFRLCRAAKSAAEAQEIVYQQMGLAGGGARRRFEVSVRPAPGAPDYVAWRIRELETDDAAADTLAAAFADYLRPVFAIEKSGQIAWANAAMRAALGADKGAFHHIDRMVLGETSDIVRKLWQVDAATISAKIRGRNGEPLDASLRAFRRGGVGEGFVCVEMTTDAEAPAVEEEAALSADLADAPFGVAVVEGEVGGDARIVEANKAFSDIFGGVKKNAPLARLIDGAAIEELAAEIRRRSSAGGAPRPVETSVRTGVRPGAYAIYARPARRRRGGYGARRTVIFATDVSERKLMEAEYRRDQKLASIGKVTGEIAHDFNNHLQVVLGNCERLMLRHPAGDPDYHELGQIRGNALRGSNMIRQLLAFSRNQTLTRQALSITELLREWTQFLNRAVGERVQIELVNGRGLPPVRVDKSAFENALMNLAVNARDAMGPAGGRLTIRTSALSAEEVAALGVPGLAPGAHLLIEISDTGPGVPVEIRDKIFEPYFTTKQEGKGTGLGLATVYGLVTQMEGAIIVDDAPGGGALFKIYLPAFEGALEAPSPAPSPKGAVDLTGAGRILVVEDEDSVRNFVVTALEEFGYEVTTAADAEAALKIIAEDRSFDLVLSDVMMPDVDGPTFIARARAELNLSAKVLFMSAYAESAIRDQIDSLHAVAYIQKPFTLKGLAAKVKETMKPAQAEAA